MSRRQPILILLAVVCLAAAAAPVEAETPEPGDEPPVCVEGTTVHTKDCRDIYQSDEDDDDDEGDP